MTSIIVYFNRLPLVIIDTTQEFGYRIPSSFDVDSVLDRYADEYAMDRTKLTGIALATVKLSYS